MQLEFSGAPTLALPRDTVWRHLVDPETLATCTPDARDFRIVAPGRYAATCAIGAGLFRIHVTLDIEVHDLAPPATVRWRAHGVAPGSTLDVNTTVHLEALGGGRTHLAWRSAITTHGMIAKLGRGMVEETLRQFTGRFWDNIADRFARLGPSGAVRLLPEQLLDLTETRLTGAVLLGAVSLPSGALPKGARLDEAAATLLLAAARERLLSAPVSIAWIGADELHEDDAARRLAAAVAGGGVAVRDARQSRVELVAGRRGVLRVAAIPLARINALDPLEVISRFDGQAVEAGEVVASAKVAPHVVAARTVEEAESLATDGSPVIEVRGYAKMGIAAIAAEALTPDARGRFEAAARLRAEALDGSFVGLADCAAPDPAAAQALAYTALAELSVGRKVPILLVGGVSAGNPLAPFFAALAALGGEVFRRGVPAHPGSMLWLGRLGETQLLGLPQCGVLGMATAVDLILPRLMTGERLTTDALAGLGHGGLLGPEMRFRFPAYARALPDAHSP
jgi:carbon monoxide dehydrogenase subunit G